MKTNDRKIQNLTVIALFTAIVVLLGMTPIGIIPLGFINVTIMGVPVVIGTMFLGLKQGLILGACFGMTSLLRAFGIGGAPSALVAGLMGVSPLYVVLMSLIPRLLMPVTTHIVYRALKRGNTSTGKSVMPAAIVGSLTNTVFYLGLMLVFYAVGGLDLSPVVNLIAGTAVIAGGAEAIACALISTPIVMALYKLKR